MTETAAESNLRWSCSTGSSGDALHVSIRERGLTIALLGRPAGPTAGEVGEWLRDLLAVAREAPPAAEDEGRLPLVLRQAISALLFSHSEIWDREGAGDVLSVVLFENGAAAGVGWAGQGEVDVTRADGGPEPVWTRVVDEDGREGHAWMLPRGTGVLLEFRWASARPGHAEADAAWLSARWQAEEAPEEEDSAEEPASPAAPLERGSVFSQALAIEERTRASGIAGQIASVAAGSPLELGAPESAPSRPHRVDPQRPAAEPPSADPTPPRLGAPELADLEPAPRPLFASVPPAPASEPADDGGLEAGLGPLELPVEPEPDAAPPERAVGGRPAPGPDEWPEVPVSEVKPRRTIARPAWPDPTAFRSTLPRWLRDGKVLAGAGAGLVVLALVLGLVSWPRGSGPLHQSAPLEPLLAALGVAPDRFDLLVGSEPAGATIRVDGVQLAQQTPARLRLKPGMRLVEVFFGQHGGQGFTVTGRKSESLRLDAVLWGSISVLSSEPDAPIEMSLDGVPRGTLPLLLDRVAPGPHQLRFSGEGLDPWERMVSVTAGQTREVMAVPMRTPGMGVLQVRSVGGIEDGEPPGSGDAVWVDGELMGRTPLTLELPRGPHSVRVIRGEVESPVQVVDLPGGNERFLDFDFSGGEPPLAMRHVPLAHLPLGYPALVSATLTGRPAPQVREMWLHVRLPDGTYRRYEMTLLAAPGGAAGSAVFPRVGFDAQGFTRYYISAVTQDGEEHFTEIYRVAPERPAPAASTTK